MTRPQLIPGVTVLCMALLTVTSGRSDYPGLGVPFTTQPGLGVMIRSDVFNRDLAQCFRRDMPVHVRAEEGEVTSLVQLAARAHLEPVLDSCRAAFNVVVYGNLIGNSVRSVEGVRAFTRERSSFFINVGFCLDPRGVSMGDVSVSMPICSELLDIRTAKPHLLESTIQTLGEIRFERGQAEDDRMISCEAEKRLRREIYQQAREPLRQANKRYREVFLNRLAEYGIYHDDLGLSSAPDAVWLTARFKGMYLPDPPLAPDHPLVVQIHPEMLNRLASDRIAGKSYNEDELEQVISDLGRYVEIPRLEKKEDRPLKVKMAQKDPIRLMVEGTRLAFTLSGESYTVGDDTYPGMNVTARYQVVRKSDAWHLIRDEELEVLPPDFKPGMGLGARQQVLRTILRRRIGRLLPQDIPLRDVAFAPIPLGDIAGQQGEQLSISATLHIEQIELDRGWVTMGLCLKVNK